MKKKIAENEQKHKNTNTKIANLEMCVSQLEIQLTDSIKVINSFNFIFKAFFIFSFFKSQDEFIRELHNEKRNLIKKMQECEDLKLTVKYLEQKCTNLDAKLSQKESTITSLKQKYIQLEQETNRIEYEYQRFRNNQTTLTLTTNTSKSNKENNEIVSYKKNLKNTYSSSSLSRSNSANSEKSSSFPIQNDQFLNEDFLNGKQHKPRIDTHYENLINTARQSLTGYSEENVSGSPQKQSDSFNISLLDPDKQIKYIEKLENDFDSLMKHKQQLDSQLTRLPQKITNASMHVLRMSIENELSLVDKKLASTKLELRKLNIIKPH
jgi:hypothetical protein